MLHCPGAGVAPSLVMVSTFRSFPGLSIFVPVWSWGSLAFILVIPNCPHKLGNPTVGLPMCSGVGKSLPKSRVSGY